MNEHYIFFLSTNNDSSIQSCTANAIISIPFERKESNISSVARYRYGLDILLTSNLWFVLTANESKEKKKKLALSNQKC